MNPFALFPVFNETGFFQDGKMKGYLWLDHVKGGDDVAHAEFSLFKEFEYP